jgi:hypothetical protein
VSRSNSEPPGDMGVRSHRAGLHRNVNRPCFVVGIVSRSRHVSLVIELHIAALSVYV